MLKLYTFRYCPYCERVRTAFADMKIPYEEVSAEPGTPGLQEVLRLGGKQQVPFLVDPEREHHLYESTDIIEYARKRFAKN